MMIAVRLIARSPRAAPLTIATLVIALSISISSLHAAAFIRGDADADGAVSITDAVAILNHLFRGGSLACEDAADVDNDGHLRVNDPMVIIRFLFQNGPRLPRPFPACGFDRDEGPADDLSCDESSCSYSPFELLHLSGNTVFVIDRSRFMQGSGELGLIKHEVARTIADFGERNRFAVITHAADLRAFPETGLADGESDLIREEALLWVSHIYGGDLISCPLEALIDAMERRGTTSVVYMGTARALCPGAELNEAVYLADALERVVEVSAGRVPIHVVEFFADDERNFLREVAESTEGVYLNYSDLADR